MVGNRRADIEPIILDMLDPAYPLSRTTLINWTTDPHRRGLTGAILDDLLDSGTITEHPGHRYTLNVKGAPQ